MIGLLAIALLVTTAGWILSSRGSSSWQSLRCRFEGEVLVLSYTYGDNERVQTVVDRRGGALAVSLHREQGSGGALSIGNLGEVRLPGVDPKTRVTYADGRPLKCR